MLKLLKEKVERMGRPQWRAMLRHAAELHEGAIHPPYGVLPYHWEEVAVGESGSPIVFGHWESIHMALDTVGFAPQHALSQILNLFALQGDDGILPAPLWIVDGSMKIVSHATFPPLWCEVIEAYVEATQREDVLAKAFDVANKQIGWFHKQRSVNSDGYYYLDCMDRFWESGVIDALRFDPKQPAFEEWDEAACVDATAHVYLLLGYAERWAGRLGYEGGWLQTRRVAVQDYLREKLFDDESGLFFDRWICLRKQGRARVFESFWPFIVGAATHYQASRVINGHILDPSGFFSPHPIPSVAINEPSFRPMGWRGAVHNSVVYWVARGCLRYGRRDAARQLLERALDRTARHFDLTGSLWEAYHPEGVDPRRIPNNTPNALGHNPLIAMVLLWEEQCV